MIRSDCHLHTSFSSDSDALMDDMAEAAIEKGLDIICFTDHMDLEFPDKYDMDFVFDPGEYMKQIKKTKSTYGGKLEILTGIEIGMKPAASVKEEYSSLLSSYDWDFVIGSTHIVDDLDPYYGEYWEGRTQNASIRRYFECVYDNIRNCDDFDSLGHLDYIIRYAPSKIDTFSYKDYADIIDCILKNIIQAGKALEINAAGYCAGLGAPNPCKEIISRYMELGGELFTIGSDAHQRQYIGYGYDKVYDLLSSLGIKYYAIYRKRKPHIRTLD